MTPLFRQIKPMIVKNIPFANLLKSFWNKIIPTANLQCWGQRAGSVPLGGSHWASIRKEHQRREAWGSMPWRVTPIKCSAQTPGCSTPAFWERDSHPKARWRQNSCLTAPKG